MPGQDFNTFADDYRDIHTQNILGISGQGSDYFSEYKIKELYSAGIVPENAAWLDLGCGDGNSLRFIRKHFPKSTYAGIDVSTESIRVANETFRDESNVSFGAYDGVNIPFDDDIFDIVYISCVLHHIAPDDRNEILSECRRVLKPGGKIIIFEHNPKNPVTMKVVNTCVFDEDAILLHYGECQRRLEKCGFRNIRRKYTIFFPRKGIFNKILGMEKALSWIPMGGQYYVVAEAE